MTKLIFVTHDGAAHEVAIEAGKSLMPHAVENAVPGIDAHSAVACACGTCHVVVEDGWIDQVGRSGPVEEEMLAMNPEREANSRLSCQMRLSDSLDGLVVRLPEFQL